MVGCFVPDCNHKSQTHKCRMFCFPSQAKSPKRRNQWKRLIRRADRSPGRSSRVCHCHFEDGNNKNLPTIFERNKFKRAFFPSPERRKRRKATAIQSVAAEIGQEGPELLEVTMVVDEHPVPDEGIEASSNQKHEEDADSRGDEVNKWEKLIKEKDDIIAAEVNKWEKVIKEKDDIIAAEVTKWEKVIKEKDDIIAAAEEKLQNQHEQIQKLLVEVATLTRKKLVVEAELDLVQNELKIAKGVKQVFTLSEISHDPKLMAHFTGLPSVEVFNVILGMFENVTLTYHLKWAVKRMSKADQLLLTLLKLRRNLSVKDLATRFKVSDGTVENVFLTWLSALHQVLVERLMAQVLSERKCSSSMPSFNESPDCRLVLDCTEIYAANPKKMSDQNDRSSNFKQRITLKALVAVAPNGTVVYLSDLYPSSVSDRTIVGDCGILNKLEEGDTILADKDFLIGDLLPQGVTLNTPPFKSTPRQTDFTLNIASPRMHVERAVRVIKTFQILDFIPGRCLPSANKVFQLCGALANFKFPLIREMAEKMNSSNAQEESS